MKLYNDIDEIYKNGFIERDDLFICSVCKREYKRRSSVVKHMSHTKCHSYRQIFEGSPVEQKLFSLYKTTCAIENKQGYTFRKFKKSSFYTKFAKWYMFCLNNNIKNINNFYEYALSKIKTDMVMKALEFSMKESFLKEYLYTCRRGTDIIRSERFFNMFEGYIKENTSFVLRSLEKGDIDVVTLFEKIDPDIFINNLSDQERSRFESFLKSI